MAGTELSDAALVRQSLEGDRAAFETMVARYQDLVCATSLSVLGDAELSRDVGQDVFVEAWRTLPALRQPERFRAWVCRMAKSRSYDAARQRKRMRAQPLDHEPPDGAADPFDRLRDKETSALVWSVVERIPKSYRVPVVLFYREGKSVAEVARHLGVTEETARQRINRGRRHVRTSLERVLQGALASGKPGRRFTAGVMGALPAGRPGNGALGAGKAFGAKALGWAGAVAATAAAVAVALVASPGRSTPETTGSPSASGAREPASERSASTHAEPTPWTTALSTAGAPAPATGSRAASPPEAPGTPPGNRGEGVEFAGYVAVKGTGAPCTHARVLLVGRPRPSAPADRKTLPTATDANGRFLVRRLAPGEYELEVSCRENAVGLGYREIVKTYAVSVPRDHGVTYAVDVPTDFTPATGGDLRDVPKDIAALLEEDRRADRSSSLAWKSEPDMSADADGNGTISDLEWQIHNDITSYILDTDTNLGRNDANDHIDDEGADGAP